MDNTYVLDSTPDPAEGLRFVHKEDCVVCPASDRIEEIGIFETPEDAVARAREMDDAVDGCALCCPEAHTMSGEGEAIGSSD